MQRRQSKFIFLGGGTHSHRSLRPKGRKSRTKAYSRDNEWAPCPPATDYGECWKIPSRLQGTKEPRTCLKPLRGRKNTFNQVFFYWGGLPPPLIRIDTAESVHWKSMGMRVRVTCHGSGQVAKTAIPTQHYFESKPDNLRAKQLKVSDRPITSFWKLMKSRLQVESWLYFCQSTSSFWFTSRFSAK